MKYIIKPEIGFWKIRYIVEKIILPPTRIRQGIIFHTTCCGNYKKKYQILCPQDCGMQVNPVEKAEFIQGRMDYLKGQGITNALELVAQELGVSPSWVSKNTAILKYEPEVRAMVRDGKLRDYSLLKKISRLRSDKRQRAIALIERGEFNAKEFFARKRYDTKTNGVNQDAESSDSAKLKPAYLKLKFTPDECVKLIDKTGYASMLDRHDPDWRIANPSIMESYVERFRQWVTEAE